MLSCACSFTETVKLDRLFGIILFCHSLYGVADKSALILHALSFLAPEGTLIIFHRKEAAQKLLTSISASLPCTHACECHAFDEAVFHVSGLPGDDHARRLGLSLIFGRDLRDGETASVALRAFDQACIWRDGQQVFSHPFARLTIQRHSAADALHLIGEGIQADGGLYLRAPTDHVAFAQQLKDAGIRISAEARECTPIALLQPRTRKKLSQIMEWAHEFRQCVTIIGGGHSGHCVRVGTVAISLRLFATVHTDSGAMTIIAGGGATIGQIVREADAAGLVVPLGARPTVGAGLILLGGMGHLSRSLGLAVDNILSLEVMLPSGKVVNATSGSERELFVAMCGAGPCFGIALSITLRAHRAEPCYVWEGHFALRRTLTWRGWDPSALSMLESYSASARVLPHTVAADCFLCWETPSEMSFKVACYSNAGSNAFIEQLRIATNGSLVYESTPKPYSAHEMFDRELYMHFDPSRTLGREPVGKLRSFKRCVLLQSNWDESAASELLRSVQLAPTKVCYIHVVHCGGKARTPNDLSSFGYRDWEFGAVVTGQWDVDDSGEAGRVRDWVHETCKRLLCQPAMGVGMYAADLGPDDAAYALHAFGDHAGRLYSLKRKLDPHEVLRFACPLPALQKGMPPMLPLTMPDCSSSDAPACVIVISGKRGVGKDFVAAHIATLLQQSARDHARTIAVCVASISDVFKQRYCLRTGADFDRLSSDREYKEMHRLDLQEAYDKERAQCADYDVRSFRDCIEACNGDVLIVTGLREGNVHLTTSAAGVSAITVLVHSSQTRSSVAYSAADTHITETSLDPAEFELRFNNTCDGEESIRAFVRDELKPRVVAAFTDQMVPLLARCVPTIEGFPRPGIRFRHVLALYHQPLALRAACEWLCEAIRRLDIRVDLLVSPESSGLVLAGSLADRLGVGVLQLRKESAKLPPPRHTERYGASFIATQASMHDLLAFDAPTNEDQSQQSLSMSLSVSGRRCMIVDDTLASGDTACAVVKLLAKAGAKPVGLACVVELPWHGGRARLAIEGIPILSVLAWDGP